MLFSIQILAFVSIVHSLAIISRKFPKMILCKHYPLQSLKRILYRRMWIPKEFFNVHVKKVKTFRILSDWQQETRAVHLLQLWHSSLNSQMIFLERLWIFSNSFAFPRWKKICSLLFGFYFISFFPFMHLFILHSCCCLINIEHLQLCELYNDQQATDFALKRTVISWRR